MSPIAILQSSYQRFLAGDLFGAEEALSPLLAAPSAVPQALLLLGIIRNAQGRVGESEALMRRAAAAEPGNPETHYNLGNLLALAGRAGEAEQCFRKALSLAPELDEARLGLAHSLVEQQRGDEAEAEIRACLAKTRRHPAALRALARLVGNQGRFAEALDLLEEIIEIEPSDAQARFDRAAALHKLGRSEESVAGLAELAGRSGGVRTYVTLGAVLNELGRTGEAETWLSEGLRAHPSNAELHRDLARVRWLKGEPANAFARDIERALLDRPDDPGLRITCAELFYRADRLSDAEVLVRRGLEIQPDNGPLLGMLGFLEDEGGRPAEAAGTLRRAMEVAPSEDRRKLLAHALMRLGDADAAFEQIQIGMKRAPRDQMWLAHLATAQRMRGDPEFERLYDFKRFVRALDLGAPSRFGDPGRFNAALAERLDQLHVLSQHPLTQSLRHGTQTPRPLTEVDDELIQEFLAMALSAVQEFASGLPNEPDHPFLGRRERGVKFAGAWSVRLRAGGRHVNHVHHEGWISSAYYVRLPRPAPEPSRAGWLKFAEPRLPMPGCAPAHWVEPRIGRLALFPSYMWHGTEPFECDDRLTIAFDVVPSH